MRPFVVVIESMIFCYTTRMSYAREPVPIQAFIPELAVLGERDVFGEVGFLTRRPRTAAVIADGPAEVYEISRPDIEKLIETNPEIIAKIEDFYETRVWDAIRKIKS